jgi:hypothetical protein
MTTNPKFAPNERVTLDGSGEPQPLIVKKIHQWPGAETRYTVTAGDREYTLPESQLHSV